MNAVSALAICFALVSICWAFALTQEGYRGGRVRFLLSAVGLAASFLGLLVTWRGLNPASAILNVLIAALVFGALLLLHRESNKHRVTRMRLRLSQANEKTSRVLSDDEMAEVFAGVRAPAGGQALEQVIHASSEPIVVFDVQGRPRIWNAAAAHSLDLARLGAADDVPPAAAPVERPLANASEAPV